MNIGDLVFYDGKQNRCDLRVMLKEIGRDETVKRLSWLHDAEESTVNDLLDKYLSGNYVDEKGIKGGDFFWGDL